MPMKLCVDLLFCLSPLLSDVSFWAKGALGKRSSAHGLLAPSDGLGWH